jgi:tetratricopeptide (TPR) repeat protein
LLGDGNVEAADDSLPWLSDSDLYAWKAFADGDDLYFDRQDEEAIPHVRRAIQLSPSFQRAHATLGLIAMSRGDRAEAQRHFANAFEYLDQVTERERLRFQGLYYSTFRRDYGRAAEFFEQLVDTYPADDVGHSNLAVTYFYERDFNAAFLAGRKAIESYPRASMYLANYALFGMYATRLDLAINQAHLALQADPTNAVSWLPIAMSAMDVGDVASARAAYESMIAAAGGYQGKGLAADKASGKLGLADASIYSGRFESARRDLIGTAEELIEGGNRYLATTVYAATADSYGAEGRLLEAVSAAEDGLSLLTERESGRMYPVDTVAALHYVNAQRFEDASSIANSFGESASSEDRAIGLTLEGLIKLHRQEHDSAIQSFHSALQVTDLWLAHFMLGRAYLASGSYEKALDEFQLCHARRGEAMAMFLDDIPTYRMIVPLKYWTAQAQAGLGLTSDAISNLEGFLELRPNGGQYVSEARDLLNQLHDT